MRRILTAVAALGLVGCAASQGGRTYPERLLGFLEALRSEDPLARKAAAEALLPSMPIEPLRSPAIPSVPPLVRALEDPQPEVRAAAAHAIGMIGPGAGLDGRHVAGLLKDPDRRVREAAILALGRLGARDSIQDLVESLEDVEIRDQALMVLLVLDPGAAPARELFRALESDLGGEGLLLWLPRDLFSTLEWYRRDAVVEALVQQGKTVAKELGGLLSSAKSRVQSRSAEALRRLGPLAVDAVPAAIELLKDDGTRTLALEVLGRIGPGAAKAVAHVARFLESDQATLRASAARTLAGIGPGAGRAVPDLVALLRDDRSDEVRGQAAVALGVIGLGSDDVIRGLRLALGDDSRQVREAAARSLLSFWK